MPHVFSRSSFIALVTQRWWEARGPKKCSYLETKEQKFTKAEIYYQINTPKEKLHLK